MKIGFFFFERYFCCFLCFYAFICCIFFLIIICCLLFHFHYYFSPGGEITNDPVLIRYQKSVMFSLLGSIGNNLIRGKSLMNISLPVRIFEARSFLQRITVCILLNIMKRVYAHIFHSIPFRSIPFFSIPFLF